MKKRILCCIFAAILLVMAVPAFAYAPNPPFGWKSTVCRRFFTVNERAWKETYETWSGFSIKPTYIQYSPSLNGKEVYLKARLAGINADGSATMLSNFVYLSVPDNDEEWGGLEPLDWDTVNQYATTTARIFNAYGESYNMESNGLCMFG